MTQVDAVFTVDGRDVVTHPHAAGPWDATMQHGSAPSALVTWIAENIPTPSPMRIARLTVDLMRPVPVAPLTFETEILREGRKIQLCAVTLLANGVVVVRATVLKIRTASMALPAGITEAPLDVPMPEQGGLLEPKYASSPFVTGMTVRAVRGGFLKLGPGAIWYRLNRPIVEGATISQVMRAVVAADFSNGSSAVLSFDDWTFLNADLSVHLARPPMGEWVLLNSESWIGPDGMGIAASRLADIHGYFGRAVQSLVIEKRN